MTYYGSRRKEIVCPELVNRLRSFNLSENQ